MCSPVRVYTRLSSLVASLMIGASADYVTSRWRSVAALTVGFTGAVAVVLLVNSPLPSSSRQPMPSSLLDASARISTTLDARGMREQENEEQRKEQRKEQYVEHEIAVDRLKSEQMAAADGRKSAQMAA